MPSLSEVQRWTARPISPGEYLRRLLSHLDVTQEELAAALDTSRFTVNQIAGGRRAVTPSMAMKLSKATGTTIDLWLNLQRNVDLFDAYLDQRETLDGITPIREPSPVIAQHVGTEPDMLAHRVLGEAFQPLERAAAEIRRKHLGSTSRLQVAVFGPDALGHAWEAYGPEGAESMLQVFCSHVARLAAGTEAPVCHFGFELAAIVLAEEPENADKWLQASFATIPTKLVHGKHEMKLTISGGMAAADCGHDLLSAAVEAAELQHNLARLRPGASEHLWSRTFRGR